MTGPLAKYRDPTKAVGSVKGDLTIEFEAINDPLIRDVKWLGSGTLPLDIYGDSVITYSIVDENFNVSNYTQNIQVKDNLPYFKEPLPATLKVYTG